MPRVITIICCLLVVLAAPLWLLMAGFSPMLFDGGTNMSALQRLSGGLIIALVLIAPIWVAFFAWRTAKAWRTRRVTPALLMAFPGTLIIALLVAINLNGFAP